MDFVHTLTVILQLVIQTLDNSDLSLTRTNFHFPSSSFEYNYTIDKLNNVFQEMTSKKNRYRLFTIREVRIGEKCARGLGYSRYLGTQDRGHSFFSTDRPRLVNKIFFSTTQWKACKRPEHFRAVIMAKFVKNWTISSDQIVMKREIIQVQERGFTERFLLT